MKTYAVGAQQKHLNVLIKLKWVSTTYFSWRDTGNKNDTKQNDAKVCVSA